MNKKLISFILTIALLLGSVSAAFATTETSVTNGDGTEGSIVVEGIVAGGRSASDTVEGTSGTASEETTGSLKADDPNNFDQTTVTVTDRSAAVTVSDITVTAGEPVYTTEEGSPINPKTEGGYNYYWSDIWNAEGGSYYIDRAPNYNNGSATIHTTPSAITKNSGVFRRIFSYDNGTPDDYEDDIVLSGFYCADINTGTQWHLMYHLVNVEDLVAEGYYSADDVDHIRAIMKYGYQWDNGDESLESLKALLEEAKANGEIDDTIDYSVLTKRQAATATNMAVWQFGNRYDEEVYLTSRDGNADNKKLIEEVYKFLITLTEEKTETPVIGEDRFINDLAIEIGAPTGTQSAEGNDLYDVTIRFTLQAPVSRGDDLIAKVYDNNGKVVKTARIVGALKEGEEEIGIATVGRKTYYVIGGLELAENEDTVFSIKLEGKQQLAEGVYLCESEVTTLEDSARRYLEFCKNPPKCFAKEFASDYNNYVAKYGDDEDAILAAIMEENGPNAYHSQNYIGYFSGVSAVDVSMQLNLNFVVDEATITSVHEFQTVVPERKPVKNDDTVDEDEEAAGVTIEELIDEVPGIVPGVAPEDISENIEDPEIPLTEGPAIANPGEDAAADEEFGELPEDPVPLAEVPPTGENCIWTIVALVSACLMMAWTVMVRRKEN